MREEVLGRLRSLIKEKVSGNWKDGWVYGKLKQEFDLQPDELEEIVRLLGFKKGWNPVAESLLENQWQDEKRAEETLKRAREREAKNERAARQVLALDSALQGLNSPNGRFSDVEMELFKLILKMNPEEQNHLLLQLSRHYTAFDL